MISRLPLAGLALLLTASLARADNWPQFRGPKRDGVSAEKGLLKKWPEKGPVPAWSFKDAGEGFSSLAIADGKVYTLGTRGKQEIVLCLDAAKGTELWAHDIGPIFTFKGNYYGDGPRSTPTVDGTRLYALGAQGILVCLDISAAKPKEMWRKDFVKDLRGVMMDSGGSYGYSESPLVDGNLLICTPGGPKGTLAALDKTKGTVVWRSDLQQEAPYSAAMVAEINGVRQYIQTSYDGSNEDSYLNGFSAKDGKRLWSHLIVSMKTIYDLAPAPIVTGNLVFQTTWDSCHLFEIGKDMTATDLYPKKAKKNQCKLTVNHGGVVLVGDHLYGYAERGWMCQEFKTGKQAWSEEEFVGRKSGSTISADGMLYLYTDDGKVGLAEANPKEFTLVSDFDLPKHSKYKTGTSQDTGSWSYPAIANGCLFLRDRELIFCYKIK
jgi:outer membrane protein assembly factor BamB